MAKEIIFAFLILILLILLFNLVKNIFGVIIKSSLILLAVLLILALLLHLDLSSHNVDYERVYLIFNNSKNPQGLFIMNNTKHFLNDSDLDIILSSNLSNFDEVIVVVDSSSDVIDLDDSSIKSIINYSFSNNFTIYPKTISTTMINSIVD